MEEQKITTNISQWWGGEKWNEMKNKNKNNNNENKTRFDSKFLLLLFSFQFNLVHYTKNKNSL